MEMGILIEAVQEVRDARRCKREGCAALHSRERGTTGTSRSSVARLLGEAVNGERLAVRGDQQDHRAEFFPAAVAAVAPGAGAVPHSCSDPH